MRSRGDSHGNLALKLEKHPALGGPGGGSNPEELFALAYAACFHSSLRHVAKQHSISIGETIVEASVSLGIQKKEHDDAPARLGLAVTVMADVRGVTDEQAQQLADLAAEFCPYARAVSGNIETRAVGVG